MRVLVTLMIANGFFVGTSIAMQNWPALVLNGTAVLMLLYAIATRDSRA